MKYTLPKTTGGKSAGKPKVTPKGIKSAMKKQDKMVTKKKNLPK